jgi:glycosyltransferase involved in cell wall biosynthesis
VIRGIGTPVDALPERDLSKKSELVVGFLGRIEPVKGLDILLDAAKSVPNVRVIVGGSGSDGYVRELRRRYSCERVEFAGYVRPGDLFQRIDVLSLPSIWEEPLPRVIYEAYSYGVPVIVPRAGGMPEIVEEGRTGFVVTPGSRSDLAALLERLANSWQPKQFFDACGAKSREFRTENRFAEFLTVWDRVAATR